MGGDSATVLFYWNDNTYKGPEGVDYSGVKSQPIEVNSQISYADLLQKIYKLTGWDRVSTIVRMHGRRCRHSPSKYSKETLIVNDQSLSALLATFQCEKAHCIELYLCRRIDNKVVKKPAVQPNEVGMNRDRLEQNVLSKSYMHPINNVTPGPRDLSILKLQEGHRSSDIWESNESEDIFHLKVRPRCGRVWIPHKNLHHIIMDAGFIGIMHIMFVQIDHALMTALVERWRQETHTFHFPVGEMTMTLEDVGMLLGLPIDGEPVTGSHSHDWVDLCRTELGLIPGEDDIKGSSLQFTWLTKNFSELPEEEDHDAETYTSILKRFAKAWLLAVIGNVLCPTSSGNIVSVAYLLQLCDLTKVIKYSWGSVVLANMYRGLCCATKRGNKELPGCVLLLQLWSWERLHIGRPKVKDAVVISLHPDIANSPHARVPWGHRWVEKKRSYYKTPRQNLIFYRSELDSQKTDEVKWQPYENANEADVSPLCFAGRSIWRAKVPLICYDVVEWHFPDRVLRQFGLVQGIPKSCNTELKLHAINKRGRHTTDWEMTHNPYVIRWSNRRDHVVNADHIQQGDNRHWDTYIRWYREITRLFIGPPEVPNQSTPSLQYHPSAALSHRIAETLAKIAEKCTSTMTSGDVNAASAIQGYQEIKSMCVSALADVGELERYYVPAEPVVSPPVRQAKNLVRERGESSNALSSPPQKNPNKRRRRAA